MYPLTTTAIAIFAVLHSTATSETRSKIVEKLFDKGYYDKNEIAHSRDGPVNVSVSAFLIQNIVIEETKTHVTLETLMYFRRHWVDSRLQFEGEPVFGSKDLQGKIWTPDLFFINSIRVESFNVPSPNTFVRISPNGSVLMSEKVAVKWRCEQTWDRFPCDKLDCALQIESYGYAANELRISKRANGLRFANETIENFILENAAFEESSVNLASGTYDRLILRLTLKRNIQDAKYVMAGDKRYPDIYSSISLKPRFDNCD